MKIIDIGSGVQWYYDLNSRCTIEEPAYFHADSDVMTVESAFNKRFQRLGNMSPADIIFLETFDYFTSWDSEENSYHYTERVWRRCRVIGPAVYQGNK